MNPGALLADRVTNFQVSLEDGELVFCGVGGHADADGSAPAVLPAAEHPTAAILDCLAPEYELGNKLVFGQVVATGATVAS